MRFTEFSKQLTEGRGVFARTPNDPPFSAVPGNTFGAKEGDPYKFLGVQPFPDNGQYETDEQLDAKLAEVEKLLTAQIIWRNQRAKNMAFALAGFMGPNNKPIYFGKFFKDISGNMHGKWDNDELPGLRPELKASKKGRAGLKPQDVLGAKDTFTNGKELLTTVLNNPTLDENIKAGMSDFAQGKLPSFPNSADNFEAIRDNLGEIIQTLALTSGLVGGDADEARRVVLKNAAWQNLSINFPGGKTAGLVDSYLRSGNLSLGVSSKGGTGADASAKNIYDAIVDAAKAGKDLRKEYPVAADITEIIATNSMIAGPLKLAVKFEMMSNENASEVVSHIKNAEMDKNKLSEWAQEILTHWGMKEPQGWNYGWWLLANIAKDVAQKINGIPEFGQQCVGILNNASMIQLYTDANAGKDGSVNVTGFKAVYPPRFSGTVLLNAGKGYNARGATQRMAFSFK